MFLSPCEPKVVGHLFRTRLYVNHIRLDAYMLVQNEIAESEGLSEIHGEGAAYNNRAIIRT
jgi:hypothetical protein